MQVFLRIFLSNHKCLHSNVQGKRSLKTHQEVPKDGFGVNSKVTEKAQLMSSKESDGKGEQFPEVIPDDDDSISSLTSLGLC